LIVRAKSDSVKWTIAGFSDAGDFRTVLLDEANRELSEELEKRPIDENKIPELATSILGRTQTCRLPCRPEEDIAMLVLRRTWLTDRTLVEDICLRRDFAGFDAPSLATETLLPTRLVGSITGTTPNDGGYDRSGEYAAAQQQLAAWTRYAR